MKNVIPLIVNIILLFYYVDEYYYNKNLVNQFHLNDYINLFVWFIVTILSLIYWVWSGITYNEDDKYILFTSIIYFSVIYVNDPALFPSSTIGSERAVILSIFLLLSYIGIWIFLIVKLHTSSQDDVINS
ncbi:hypothetical protein [Cytophaga aurantiaca]|uniref:hypothetical protein n=1 Tax=Cytophaga aurantiaca TaxID=29530 RepID=UPI000372B339|nr:hypothetical protein [Cytophaga aurantiaca]